VSYRIKFDFSRFDQLVPETIRTMSDCNRRAVSESVIAGANYARHTHAHRVRTGTLTGARLFGRLTYTDDTRTDGEIVNTTPYARFVEYPTRPHVIRPKEGYGLIGPLQEGQTRRARTDIGTHRSVLKFFRGGRKVYAKMVNHPGNRTGFPFMEPAGVYAGDQIIFETEHVTFVLAAALWD